MSQHAPDPAHDRPSHVHWPPILYVATLVAAWALERWLPLPAVTGGGIARWAGVALIVLGVGSGLLGIAHFRRIGTAIDPTGRATRLAVGGIYGYTRNPMYMGAVTAFLGLALALPSTWLLVLTPAMALGLSRLAISREEAYLERRFGADYLEYKERVRRWL